MANVIAATSMLALTALSVSGAQSAGARPRATPPARGTATYSGELAAGQAYTREFGEGLRFALVPRPLGWEIVVTRRGRDENLARLTPPFHFAPNPREIEGWHFRNADNSGPNEDGDKNVNAPGEVREFIFSPAVGATIDGPDAGRPPTPDEVDEVRRWGQGTLAILEYRLADLGPGKTARFAWMRFTVHLSWPPDARPPAGPR
jgi:hypothetical protein